MSSMKDTVPPHDAGCIQEIYDTIIQHEIRGKPTKPHLEAPPITNSVVVSRFQLSL